jgi:hypothetical protein
MTVNPQDQAGRTNGTTNFSRSYLTNTNVTIAAPTTDTASGLFFAAWTGCDAVSGIINSVCSVTTGTADRTISAAYGGDGCGIEKVFNIKDNIEICPPLQTITIYDNFTFAGQPVGTHTTGDQGTVVGGPGDFEGTPYYQASFVTAPTLGWLTSVNIRSTTGPVIPPVIPSPSVQVGVGKYGAGVQIK